jgi:hypothetical protein
MLVALYGVGRRCVRAVPFAHGVEEALFALGLGFGLFAHVTLALGEAGVLHAPMLWIALAAATWLGRREIVSGLARAARGGRRFVATGSKVERTAVALGLVVLAVECLLAMAPAVGGDQTKYQLVYPRIFAEAHALIPTPWSFWGTCSTSSTCSYRGVRAPRRRVGASHQRRVRCASRPWRCSPSGDAPSGVRSAPGRRFSSSPCRSPPR